MLIEISDDLAKEILAVQSRPLSPSAIQSLQKAIDDRASTKPLIVIGVEGGIVQGVSTTSDMDVFVLDHDLPLEERVIGHAPVVGDTECRKLLSDAEVASAEAFGCAKPWQSENNDGRLRG